MIMKILSDHLLHQPRFSRFMRETVLHYKGWSVITLLLRSIALSEKLLWPLFIKILTDALVLANATGVTDWDKIIWTLVFGLTVWALPEISEVASNIISGRRLATMRANIRLFILADLYKQSQQFFHDRFAGSISTSMRDVSESVSDVLNEVMTQVLPAVIVFFVTAYVFFQLDKAYTIVLGFWMMAQIAVIFFTKKISQKKSRDYADQRSEMFGKLIDSVTNYLSVASFTAHAMEHHQIREAEDEVIDKRSAVVNYTQLVYLGSSVLEICTVFFGFLPIYLYLFAHGRATVGDLMFTIMGVYGMMSIVRQISNRVFWLYEQIGIGQEAIRKIVVPRQIEDKADATELQISKARIDIDHLDFHYLPDRPVLRDVSFSIEGGQKIGLIGYSGAGKTTFVNLLMRFYDITGGRILIDGQDIREVTQQSLRRAIALIPQDTSLFHRSLRENIRIARPEATEEEIITASKRAGAHEFIMSQQHQYDTLVGERGIKLSGGQRQRIAIARAFLKAAPILILDEATSALDSMTEKGIQDALDEVMTGRTTIVIAHRLSTLRQMDRILVFDHGKIVEDGTHETLLTLDGPYARMWKMQAGGFLPEKDPESLSGAH